MAQVDAGLARYFWISWGVNTDSNGLLLHRDELIGLRLNFDIQINRANISVSTGVRDVSTTVTPISDGMFDF